MNFEFIETEMIEAFIKNCFSSFHFQRDSFAGFFVKIEVCYTIFLLEDVQLKMLTWTNDVIVIWASIK